MVVEGQEETTTILGSRVPTAVCYTRDNIKVSHGWGEIYQEVLLQVMQNKLRSVDAFMHQFLGQLSSAFYKGMNIQSPANSFLGGLDASRR